MKKSSSFSSFISCTLISSVASLTNALTKQLQKARLIHQMTSKGYILFYHGFSKASKKIFLQVVVYIYYYLCFDVSHLICSGNYNHQNHLLYLYQMSSMVVSFWSLISLSNLIGRERNNSILSREQ